MDKVMNQFRRLYDDRGANDIDFTEQEKRLRLANDRLEDATKALVRSSEKLNSAAISAQRSDKATH